MTTIGAFEAKTHFSELLRKAEQGEAFEIQRRGKPVAMLMGKSKQADVDALQEALAYFREMRGQASAREISAWREEGRR